MSDVEEPPAKVVKIEGPSSMDSTVEGQEEHEEWLSEGVLTDDDYLQGNISNDQKPNLENLVNTSQDSQNITTPQQPLKMETEQSELNIEDTLNNFEKTESMPEEDPFDKLLKTETKESDVEKSGVQSEDDGNDTDDLLRMLGEDEGKMKKKVLTTIRDKQARHRGDQSSDDEYIFQGAKVTKLKVAKNALVRKQATKAEPEDMSDRDSDMSEDEGSTVKRMFATNVKSRPSANGGRAPRPSSQPYTNNVNNEKPKPTPKQYTNKASKSLLKPREHEEIINEEEFLEQDEFDLEDDMGDDASLGSAAEDQLIRRPERMDEEVPSDDESHDDEDSLYDVMPSSDSEDMDDWFTLDIRAERAGDYLPWLGDKAHKLLTEEKHRVTARLAALKQSVSALKSSERVQSDQIKVATEALHELDAMLAAA